MLAAILICGAMTMLTSCSKNDKPVDEKGKTKVFRLAQAQVSVDSGEQDYFLPLLESLDESLYGMGLYGMRPKHLLTQMTVTTKGNLLSKTMDTNIVRKYDYTLVNGVVTGMVMNSSSKMTIGDITTEKQNQKKYTFVWE